MINAHYIISWRQAIVTDLNFELFLVSVGASSERKVLYNASIEKLLTYYDEKATIDLNCSDVAVLVIKDFSSRTCADITNKFVSKKSMRYLHGELMVTKFYHDMLVSSTSSFQIHESFDTKNPTAFTDRVLKDVVAYYSDNAPGDCGSLLLLKGTWHQKKIFGIHSMGIPTTQMSCGVCIWEENIASIKYLLDKCISDDPVESLKVQGYPVIITDNFPKYEFGNKQVICEWTKRQLMPSSTALSRSAFTEEDLGVEMTQFPASLRKPPGKDFGFNVMHEANKGYCVDSILFVSDQAIDAVISNLKDFHRQFVFEDTRVIPYESCFVSDPELNLEGLSLSTSGGVDLAVKFNAKHKRAIFWNFDKDILDLESETAKKFKDYYDQQLELVKKGIRMPVIWKDSLKDELRSLEKALS